MRTGGPGTGQPRDRFRLLFSGDRLRALRRRGSRLGGRRRGRCRPLGRQCGRVLRRLLCRRGVGRDFLERLAEVGDLVEGAVLAGFGEQLQPASGCDALRIGVANRVAVEGFENRGDRGVVGLDGVLGVDAHAAAEAVDGVERVAARVESRQRLAGAVLVLQERQRLHQVADGGHRLPQLAAHGAQDVGDLIGAEDKHVEVGCVPVDQARGLVQRFADLSGLERQPRLLEGFPGRAGDAANDVDIRYLADPVGHLLHIGQRLGCAQVMR